MVDKDREGVIRVDLRLTGRVAGLIREALLRRKGEELSARDIGKEIKRGVIFLANEGFFEYENPFKWLEEKAKEYLGIDDEREETEEVKKLLEELKVVVEKLENLGVPVRKVVNFPQEEGNKLIVQNGKREEGPLVGLGDFTPQREEKEDEGPDKNDGIKISIDF